MLSPAEIARLSSEEASARGDRLRLLPRIIVVGLLAGTVAVAFRMALGAAEAVRTHVLTESGGPWTVVLHGLVAAVCTAIAVLLVRHVSPAAGGSGIPQLKAVLLHMRRLLPMPVLAVKFIGGVLTIGAGLALGREGPTIQMGGATGKLTGRLMGMTGDERFILIAAGAGAGLSAAFNAPLAGLVFVLEEIQRAFHRRIFFATLLASVVADTVSRMALGQEPVFEIPSHPIPPLTLLPLFAFLGVAAGLLGVAFNHILVRSIDLVPRLSPGRSALGIGLLAGTTVAATAALDPGLVGGGHELTESALSGKAALSAVALVLAVRFILTMISYGTGAPGGIFAPLLVLGAYAGLGLGLLADQWTFMDIQHPSAFAVVGMAALFAATVRAPLTGIVLITEMTGEHTLMLPLLVASLTAFFVADHLGCRPIYHTLMDREMNDYQRRVESAKKEDNVFVRN